MLIGTAVLTMIDILIEENRFKQKHDYVRNIGLVLAHFIQFAHNMEGICRRNEDSWKKVVVAEADEYGIKTEGLPNVESEVRKIRDSGKKKRNELGENEKEVMTKRVAAKNIVESYESRKLSGIITLEMINEGLRRCWDLWDWNKEVGRILILAIDIDTRADPGVLGQPSRQSRALWANIRQKDWR